MALDWIKFLPWLPALATVLCGICCLKKSLRPLAAWICVAALAAAFALTMAVKGNVVPGGAAESIHAFEWVHIGRLHVDFAYLVDPLTIVMLCVVTGIGTLVAWYAVGYMAGDKGYARFFAFVSLFIFAMTTLVMADNLVLLYLGWEGVGLCSYLLIGHYYDKPSAVAAAKKAFIVNRVGDLGFAIGIFLTYTLFHTLQISEVIAQARDLATRPETVTFGMLGIPFLLMLGAFGKSAQLPLYMWLPDAMEGPTPVSALMHAATMVTAGVYMIARLFPLFALSPYALPTVAVVGGVTALFAATIALCQYDIKRIWAYSTISQLGYMFLGVGAMSTVGGIFHLFTHAFFKALLFLTAGSVMHALGGQLDLRKMSGMRRRMPVTAGLMFVGCLALAGFPLTAGFFSKDMILADTMARGLSHDPNAMLYLVLAIVGLFTAFLTAFYTFRLWFRVFMGPTQYEMGAEAHAHDEAPGHDAAGHDAGHAEPPPGRAVPPITVEHHNEPHEMGWSMNAPLVVLAIGALVAGFAAEGWITTMVNGSTASLHGAAEAAVAGGGGGGAGPAHLNGIMMGISSVLALLGIGLAAYYHWLNRPAADQVARQFPGLVWLLGGKYFVDELVDAAIVRPLRLLGEVLYIFDQLIINSVVNLVGWLPRALGITVQPTQRGALQGYGLGMAVGAAIVLLLVLMAMR